MKSRQLNNWYYNIDVSAYDDFFQYHPIITQIRYDTEQIKDQERKSAILSNLEPPPLNNILDPNDVVDLWVQYFEKYFQKNSNGSFHWSSLVSQVTNFAYPERPSNLLPSAGYKNCSNEILMKNRRKIKKYLKILHQNPAMKMFKSNYLRLIQINSRNF